MEIVMEYDRLGIELRSAFVERNLTWWRERPRAEEEAGRKYRYEHFLDFCQFPRDLSGDWTVGEVGAGPYGGILRICNLPAKQRYYIDYIQKELCELGFIDWSSEDVYVTAPAEQIPLQDKELDCLVSYNCLDHGWDIEQALSECFRVARRCYLSFDCRGDSAEQIRERQGKDLDHWQLLRFQEVKVVVARLLPDRAYSVRDMGIKPGYFPETAIVVGK